MARTKLDPPLNCWKSSSILFPENGYDINLCDTYYQVSDERGNDWTFTPCYRDGDWCRQAGETTDVQCDPDPPSPPLPPASPSPS